MKHRSRFFQSSFVQGSNPEELGREDGPAPAEDAIGPTGDNPPQPWRASGMERGARADPLEGLVPRRGLMIFWLSSTSTSSIKSGIDISPRRSERARDRERDWPDVRECLRGLRPWRDWERPTRARRLTSSSITYG
jgi:hypothetical protein